MAYHNAHAARIDENNLVCEVIVIPYCNDDDDEITNYCNSIGLEGKWIDCSYLGKRRKMFPGMGDIYDEEKDEFVRAEFEFEVRMPTHEDFKNNFQ
jgi:hypothetical protein